MVNGVSGGLEALAWIISDPGDVVIVPTPTYARWLLFYRAKNLFSRFFADMNERMQTKVVGMHLEEDFVLTPQLLESEILRQRREGGNVKGFLFCNPNNPLGVVYPRQLAIDLMEVCKRHKVMCSFHYFYCRFLKTVSWSDIEVGLAEFKFLLRLRC